ncbi:hypothetical protein ANCCEY_09415 [Ancylostoma ceylanicum]|uniref:Exoribonuclease phosphorolytic domain-containing protein n=1 Tax=Ancylostoma ceylanicum TaxID=53326 RepID=A0A0D6LJY9_9BILA|nr:hypothetical protein ANCCEY_09415 [Ancylostoma ceylanicum]
MPYVKTDFSIPLCELTREDVSRETEENGGNTFRPVCFKCRVFDGPPGSAYAEFGETKLKMKGFPEDARIGSQILSVVKTCVMAHKYSQCEFEVEVTVLSDDGGLLQCALMATILALTDAEVLMLDVVVAAHIARTPSGEIIVDPRKHQIVDGYSECTLALMPNQNQIVCCDLRGGQLNTQEVEELITFATEKAMKLYPVLRKALLATIAVEEGKCSRLRGGVEQSGEIDCMVTFENFFYNAVDYFLPEKVVRAVWLFGL